MLQHLETFNHAVSSIKHPNEKPNFVFMPDAFHDKNPFDTYTSESFITKLFFYLLLLPDGAALREVLLKIFLYPISKGESL